MGHAPSKPSPEKTRELADANGALCVRAAVEIANADVLFLCLGDGLEGTVSLDGTSGPGLQDLSAFYGYWGHLFNRTR